MPFKNVTYTVLSDEVKEMEEILKNSPEAREAHEQFEAEYKLRSVLVNARKKQNITQAELKERIGVTQQVISHIETNNEISPSLKTLLSMLML